MLVSLALQIHTCPVLDPFKHTSIKQLRALDCSVRPVLSRKAGKLMDFMKGTVPQNVPTETDRPEGRQDSQVMYSSPTNDGTQLSMSKSRPVLI